MTDEFGPIEKRVVPSEMPRQAPCKLAFVGEAPSDHESERLRPLVGPSGKLFDAMLRSAGIERQDCFVGNVFSRQLAGNSTRDEEALIGREAFASFYKESEARLAQELAEARPTVVVPMGGTSLSMLAGTQAIASLRGSAMMGKGDFSSYKLVPTYHPAHVLRKWDTFTIVVGDLIRASAEADLGPALVWPKRSLIIAPSIEEVESFLDLAIRTDLLSCDIETGWGQIRGVSFAPNAETAIYVPFISLAKLSRSYWETPALEKRAWLAVKRALESDVPKLGQNFGNYDAIWLLTKMGIRVKNCCHDLRLLHKALCPELGAGLAFMASAYSRQGAWKQWSKGKHGNRTEEEKRDA